MEYLIVYDISNNKTRLKVARFLQKYGFRIQLSAFYILESDEKTINFIYKTISKWIDKRTDRVFFYPVSKLELFEGYPLEPWDVFVL